MLPERVAGEPADSNIRTYEANRSIQGPLASLAMAWRELYTSRHVIWHLFVRDFVAGFRQKLLGYLWVVIAPVIGIASFVFMQLTGVLNPGTTDIPYPLYVFIGTSIWGLLVSSITIVANGLIGNADLVMRTSIPKIALAVTGMAALCYNLLVNLFVLVILLLVLGQLPSPWALAYPLLMLPSVLLGMGIGLMLAVVGAVARDVTGMFLTFFNLLMYVTPVVYTAQFSEPVLQKIVAMNPLTYLVDTPRSLFVSGTAASPTRYLLAVACSLVVLWLGVHAFYLIKDKVAERL